MDADRNDQMVKLQKEVTELRSQIEMLTITIEKLAETTGRMDSHISFVEQTYSTMRAPLDYVRERFWGTGDELPPAPNLLE